ELRDIQQRTGVTTVLVTHDQDEALSLATQIGIMLDGRVLQVGEPREIYDHPRMPVVARFVGDANLLRVADVRDGVLLLDGGLRIAAAAGAARSGSELLVRPERVLVGAAARAAAHPARGRVHALSFLGSDQLLTIEVSGDLALKARARPETLPSIRVG